MVARVLIFGFIAGFLAVPTGHQIVLWSLAESGLIKAVPWRWAGVPPWGVPAVVSASFFGGLWGMVLALVLGRLGPAPGVARSLIVGLAFGAVFPTLVAWFVVAPLKGLPLGNGFTTPGIITGLSVNGAWGLVTAALLQLASLARPAALAPER